MKLWVDDERPAPDETWNVAEASEFAISVLEKWQNSAKRFRGVSELDEVSLDHDLGGDDSGFKVLDWMIAEGVWPKVLTIHTSNPPARHRMVAAAHAEAPSWVEIYTITDHLRGK